ncbi:glycosyltransferase family 2 protein [Rhizobium azibense]|uniref:Glycosyltransferase involved in cell wall biosynthesis n=1 Tax=Rhizobium azibense TaxID=1136135 RepID=A0A4R3RBK0_9HYPH|nr:glycosyltransferase family 2 protein [Rhizobium azibense]TCU32793.1 glycosyltransferase involved in cell wall biosynthesis [Rhizobium azibense]
MFKVSVIVPLHNAGAFLTECVASVELSSGVETEIIVVDDASDDALSLDHTNALVVERRIKLIRNSQNVGVQASRNLGLKAATGDFVVCLDADDILLPLPNGLSYLSEAVDILNKNPDIVFVHTMSQMFGDFSGLTISSYPLEVDLVLRKHHVPISIVYRKSELASGIIHRKEVPKWQDWAFGVSLIAERWRRGQRSAIGFVPGPGYGYRIHSAFPRISRKLISEIEAAKPIVSAYRDFFSAVVPEVENDIEALASAIVARKPNRLTDLLYMARYDLEQAKSVAKQRAFSLKLGETEQLGIP